MSTKLSVLAMKELIISINKSTFGESRINFLQANELFGTREGIRAQEAQNIISLA